MTVIPVHRHVKASNKQTPQLGLVERQDTPWGG